MRQMSFGTRKIAAALVTGGLTFVLTHYWRDFPYRLALLSSISVAILTYSAVQATERLRHLYRDD